MLGPAKNPAGFNITLKTVRELKGKNLLLVLNDRIPDGGDISWIWDVDFEQISGLKNIAVSGRRTDDLVLRLDYAGIKTQFSESDLKTALKKSLNGLKKQENGSDGQEDSDWDSIPAFIRRQRK